MSGVGVVFGQAQKSLLWSEASEIILSAEVVAGVVGRSPVAKRIDFEYQLLGAFRLYQQQLALGTSDSSNSSWVSFNWKTSE